MSGTKIGGLRAAQTNKERYGADWYSKIGRKGGQIGRTGGFAARLRCDGNCDLDNMFGLEHRKAQCAGYKGGRISRRNKGY